MPATRTSNRRVRARAPETTREALVGAAYAQLAEHGFEGLRTREIAGAVGVNIATLHYYFPHKQDLVRSVVGHAMARFRSTLSGSGAPNRSSASPPIDSYRRRTSIPACPATCLSTATAGSITSGPIPSPGSTQTL